MLTSCYSSETGEAVTETIWPAKQYISTIWTFTGKVILAYNNAGASQMALEVKNVPANARDIRDTGSIPGLVRSPEAGHGNTLQYSYLDNSMDRGAWQATVHGLQRVRHD